jgi:predicted glycosyltransferase
MRFLLYSHDGLGLGHTRRHLAVASALSEICPDTPILLVTGADDVYRLGLPEHIEILKLPGLRKVANDHYSSRRLRIPIGEIRALRSALLHTAVKSFRPNVVLVDKHPFGVKGEFRAGLEELKKMGGKAVLGLRDILDEPTAVAEEWGPHKILKKVGDFYDLVMVYGSRDVFDPVKEYHFPQAVSERTQFCGYVVHRHEGNGAPRLTMKGLSLGSAEKPVVLATAGGGEDGYEILRQFLVASIDAPWQAVVVTGPLADEGETRMLEAHAAKAGAKLFRFVPQLAQYFSSVSALVCMGGYNTLAEALFAGIPTICVPRALPRKEQLLRAVAFERLGLLQCIEPSRLSPAALRDAVDAALKKNRKQVYLQAAGLLQFNGAMRAARHLLELAEQNKEAVRKMRISPAFSSADISL